MKFSNLLYNRVISAFLSFPDLSSWLIALLLLLIIAPICLSIGVRTGLLRVRVSDLSVAKAIRVSAICFFFPAVVEELLFRVLLIPHKTEHISITTQLAWVFISLSLYVFSHPLNAVIFYKKSRATFTNPIFLLLTLILGTACTISYFQSGSIWTSVIIHWITVVVWLLLLDGYATLNRS